MKAHVGVLRGLGSEDQSSRRLRVCSGWEVFAVSAVELKACLLTCVWRCASSRLRLSISNSRHPDRPCPRTGSHSLTLIGLVFSRLVKSSGENNPGEHVALIKKQEKHIFEIQSQRALPPRQMCALLPPMRKRWGFLKGHFVSW